MTQRGVAYHRRDINIDSLIEFEDSVVDNVIKEIELFWTLKKKFDDYGYLHRRGYLFFGPQGSGKSMAVQQIISGIVERKGIAFLCNCSPSTVNSALSEFRLIEPKRHVVCIFEDIDAYVESYSENSLLALLDGENQINDVLNIATTNYPEKLDKRIVARPRRFDRIIKVAMPSKGMRLKYLHEKLKINKNNVEMWAEQTEGFSFAALAELVIGVECLGNEFETMVNTLRDILRAKKSSSDFDTNKTGF
jgi:SpoVK/Ycf46/Vps4 family AAA+-type ATPase